MEEFKRSLQQARAGFCTAGLDLISTTGKGSWSEDWNCKDPVRPEIAQAIKERQEVTLSGIEEEEERKGDEDRDRSEEEKRGDENEDEKDEKESEVRIREEEDEETRKPRVGRIPTAPTKK